MSDDNFLTIASFEKTTQDRFWLFAKEQLAEKRKKANKTAADAVVRNLNNDMLVSPAKKQKPDDGGMETGDAGGGAGQAEPVKPAEELVMLEYYQNVLVSQGKKLKFPDSIEATAIVFLKRFYLSNSIMDYHPKEVMLTVMWLSCKVEHYPHRYIGAEKVYPFPDDDKKEFKFDCRAFAELGKIDPDDLIRLEQIVLDALKYHLMVFHPYRPLRGFVEAWAQLQTESGPALPEGSREKVLKKAAKVVRETIRSDVPLLHKPSSIALFALRHAASEANVSIAPLLQHCLPDPDERAQVNAALDEIKAAHSDTKPQLKGDALKKEAQQTDAKLQHCRNPEKDKSSKMFQQMEKQKDEEKQRTRDEKNRKRAEDQRERDLLVLGLPSEPAPKLGDFELRQPP